MLFSRVFFKKRLLIATVSLGVLLTAKGNAAIDNHYNISLDINRTGSFALASWTHYDGITMDVHAKTFDGSWSADLVISSSGDTAGLTSYAPVVAVNDSGDGVVIWAYFDTVINHQALAAALYTYSTNTWGPATRISGNTEELIANRDDSGVPAYSVKISNNGDVTVTYAFFLNSDRAVSATRYSAGSWSTTQLGP